MAYESSLLYCIFPGILIELMLSCVTRRLRHASSRAALQGSFGCCLCGFKNILRMVSVARFSLKLFEKVAAHGYRLFISALGDHR